MTDDGETPDAESDDGDDGRPSAADRDEPASATEAGGDGDRSTPDADSTRGDHEPIDRPSVGRDDEAEPDAGGADRSEEEDTAGVDGHPSRDDEEVASTAAGRDQDAQDADDTSEEPETTDTSVEPGAGGEDHRRDADVERDAGAIAERDAGAEVEDVDDAGADSGTSSDPVDRGTDAGATDGDADVDGDGDADVDGWDVAAGSEGVTPEERPRGAGGRGAGASRGEGPRGATGEFDEGAESDADAEADVPADVRSYDRFKKVDRASYDRVNEFLRDRTYITAREWAIARLCADFRTATGVEMTKIGENLPHLVPFMTDTYSPQAVNQARSAFEEKVRMAGATFLYGAMSGFFTADELDEIMYEVTEVAKFLLEVEGVELTVDEELDAEDRISAVMREVRQASEELRYEDIECPECGHHHRHPAAEAEAEVE